MRLSSNIVLWFLPLLMSGCNFFYSTVEYRGKEAEPRLCVVSCMQPPSMAYDQVRVDVLHSEFFLYTGRTDIPVLQDAQVSLQVNHASPMLLPFVSDPDTIYSMRNTYDMNASVLSGYFSAPVAFAALDTLRLQVSHPVYGTADAVQVCPAKQAFTLTLDSVSQYGEMWCHLHLAPYAGSMSDVLTLQAVTQLPDARELTTYIYTEDTCAARYDNVQLLSYFAGAQLHLPVSAEARDIPVVLDAHIVTDTLQLIMYALTRTREDYEYKTSLDRVLARSMYVPVLSSMNESDPERMGFTMEELFNEIAESFDVLGQAENYQVYGNLTGTNTLGLQPFGCFSLVNLTEQTIHYIDE